MNNPTSSKENKEVMEWLSQNGAEDQFISKLQRKWNSAKPGQVDEKKQNQMLDNIHNAILKSSKVNKGKHVFEFFLKSGKVAATFLTLQI